MLYSMHWKAMPEIFTPNNEYDRRFVDFFSHIWSTSQATYSQLEATVNKYFQKIEPMVVLGCISLDFKCVNIVKPIAK